ncbi:hypothetical protein ACJ41O_013962 [Fusarium nematophilum]
MKDVTYYSNSNISGYLLAPHITFSLVATCLVGLRLYTSRVVAKTRWKLDEYVLIAALFANHVMLICEGVGVPYGFGSDMITVTMLPGGVTPFFKSFLSMEISYGTACPLSKLAVLTMYYRIFCASRVIRYCVWVISVMLVGWGVAVVAVSIFACDPVAGFWDPSIPSSCIDSDKFFIGITVPNIIFDVLTVALPIREVWKLQMGREKKLAITGVFLLGGSVVLASIARLILFIIYRPGGGANGNNVSQSIIMPHTASAIETCLAIIGACMPPCAPLFRRFVGGVTSAVSRDRGSAKSGDKSSKNNLNTLVTIGKLSNRGGGGGGGGGVAGRKWTQDDDLERSSFERFEEGSRQGSTDDLCIDRETRNKSTLDLGGGIQVQHDVHVESGGERTSADNQKWYVGDIPLREMSPRPYDSTTPSQAP